MAETKEVWVNVYDDYQDDGWDTREHADAGVSNIDKRVRLDRYVLAESFPEPPAPPPVSEPVVDEPGWVYWDNHLPQRNCKLESHGPMHAKWDNIIPVIVRSAAADEELRDKLANAAVDLTAKEQTIATLTRERDEARAQLGGSQAHVKTLHELRDMDASRIADLERQLAEATKPALVIDWGDSKGTLKDLHDGDIIKGTGPDGVPFVLTVKRGTEKPTPPPPADEAWMERAWDAYSCNVGLDVDAGEREPFVDALRFHAPAPRYPEVCDFLDAMNGKPWFAQNSVLSSPERAACVSIIGANYFGETFSEACRAALDSVKERADG